MVLAAYGVDHEELVKLAKPLLVDMPLNPRPTEPSSIYVGGDFRCQAADSDVTHVAIAFEVPGGWHKEKDAMALTVLQMLMGGGGSFSAGGPGKGMYSRLYLRVLNRHQEMQSFSASNNIYNNTGLFGIHATTKTEFITTVQQRGAAIIKARKLSSALSAASSACDHIRDWVLGTPKGTWVSMGVYSDGSYGIPAGIVYSFPLTCEKGEWSIVQGSSDQTVKIITRLGCFDEQLLHGRS